MTPPLDDATRAQIRAADPGSSTWVTANAGSGKTRVLTDRVARLLLGGAAPERILCLTFTNAAAAHMQNKLFERLGRWALLDDRALRADLAELGEDAAGLTPDRLAEARRLFAQALETPGGLKIQTIHSFCASVLRRFPLEAGVSPAFREFDARTQALLRGEVMSALADDPASRDAFMAVATFLGEDDLADLPTAIEKHRDLFCPGLEVGDFLETLGEARNLSLERLWAKVFPPRAADVLTAYARLLVERGSKTSQKQGEAILALDLETPSADTLKALEGKFLYGAKGGKDADPFSPKFNSHPPNKALCAAFADRTEALHALMERIALARPRRLALATAWQAARLNALACAYLARFDAAKAEGGFLDFDDMIQRVIALFDRSEAAQWVLWRLDGGIEHILIDEAQDTSPQQWRVIERLAEEFWAGQGARDGTRTLFVVGDPKQSIYSFQGADARVFSDMHGQFGARLQGAGSALQDAGLEYSFRTAGRILGFVDQVFGPESAASLGERIQHIPFFSDRPGRVDIWPLVPQPEAAPPRLWHDTGPVVAEEPAHRTLAGKIAEFVSRELASGRLIETRDGVRPLGPGDVLILLRSRQRLFFEIVRALKAAGVPVAGADRLRLSEELAVRDLLALLRFLDTPSDDLSLACVLRSPLVGLNEAELFALAHGRKGSLWQALEAQRDRFAHAVALVEDLRRRVDYARPFELIARVLTRWQGRARLVARLGPQAGDAIDALVDAALQYEADEAPSLTGFLRWFTAEDQEVKRELEAAGSEVRVMTVHGAKGLEAPLVIVPDTHRMLEASKSELILELAGRAFPGRAGEGRPPALEAVEDERRQRLIEEERRIGYVAFTRAESWLVIAGIEPKKDVANLYNPSCEAAQALGAVGCEMPTGPGLRLEDAGFDRFAAPAERTPHTLAEPPEWLKAHPAEGEQRARRANPSALGPARDATPESAPQPAAPPPAPIAGAEGLDAASRGTFLHRALEFLPGRSAAEIAGLLRMDGCPETAAAALAARACEIAESEEFGWIFSPDALAEAGISAPLPELGGQVMEGSIDRLIVGEGEVRIVDFKSNAAPPEAISEVPEAYLRQLGAYAAACAQIWPGRPVRCFLLWTATARLMELPHEMVMAALSRAATS